MQKRVLKKTFILLAFFGLISTQVSAQTNGNFNNGGGDNLWSNVLNWSTNPVIPDGKATAIDGNPILNGNYSVTQIATDFDNGDRTFTASSDAFALTIDVGQSEIIKGFMKGTTTFDMNIILNTTNKTIRNFHNGNTLYDSAKLIFGANSTLTLNNNNTVKSNTPNPIEFNGKLAGSGILTVLTSDESGTGSNNGAIVFGSSADNSTYTGSVRTYAEQVTSNIEFPNMFIPSAAKFIFSDTAGSLIVNGENTFEGTLQRLKDGDFTAQSTVVFNANQDNITAVHIYEDQLNIELGASVTNLEFGNHNIQSALNPGILNIVNFKSGVIRIGGGALTATTLANILIDGAAPVGFTLSQTTYGYLVKTPIATITSAVDGAWEVGATWTGGVVPAAGDNVVINHNVTLDSDVEVNDFTIDGTGETLNVRAGWSITITGKSITDNNLVLQSNATQSASYIAKGGTGDVGQIQYYKYTNGTPNNDLISSPVAVTFTSFVSSSPNSTKLYENPAQTTTKLFGPFNNATGAYVNYDTATDGAEALVAGKGYRAAHVDGGTLRFKGVPSETDVEITLTDEAVSNATYGLWNLIGNPFGAYLDFTKFFNINKASFDASSQAIYGYNGGATNKWDIYNLANLPAGSKIAPAQGFFVKSISGGATVYFDKQMRTIGNTEDFVSKSTSKSENRALAKLQLTIDGNTHNTSVYFIGGRTRGLDAGYDAEAYGGNAAGIFTDLVADSKGKELGIQALDYTDFNDVIIPLGIKAEAGKTLTIGLEAATMSVPSNINIYLEDKEDNSFTLLNNADYTFTAAKALNGLGRFNVYFTQSVLSIETITLNKLQIYTSVGNLFIKGEVSTSSKASVFDIQGRLVISKNLDMTLNSNKLDVSNLGSGVYIVKVNNGKQTETKKVIIK